MVVEWMGEHSGRKERETLWWKGWGEHGGGKDGGTWWWKGEGNMAVEGMGYMVVESRR